MEMLKRKRIMKLSATVITSAVLLLFALVGCHYATQETEHVDEVTHVAEATPMPTDEPDAISEPTIEPETEDDEPEKIEVCYIVNIESLGKLSELDGVLYMELTEIDYERLDLINEYVYDLRQEYNKELRNMRLELFGEEDFGQEDFELIASDQILFYRIRYVVDDEEVIGFISAPTDYLSESYPVLIWNRGGNGNFGKNEGPEVWQMAQQGFIVLATQYRGVDGGTGYDRFGGADVYDVLKLIDFAEMFSFSSGDIYMFGWSRGAMQTYIVLSRDDRIVAAVAGAGPSNLIESYREGDDPLFQRVLRTRVGGTPETVPEEFKARSAIFWPEKLNTPLLIVHGTADERVGYHHSQELYDSMYALGKNVKLILFQDMDHYAPGWAFLAEYFLWLRTHS